MNGKSGKCPRSTLGESYVRKALLLSCLKDIRYAIRNIVKSELVDRKVPEFY